MGSTKNTLYNAWAVAKQMGHLNPDTHAVHYAHLVDLCMPLYLEGIFRRGVERILESAIPPSTRSYNAERNLLEIASREVERAFGANSRTEVYGEEEQTSRLRGWCETTRAITLQDVSTTAETLAECALYLGVGISRVQDVRCRSRQFSRIRGGQSAIQTSDAPSPLFVPGEGGTPEGSRPIERKLLQLYVKRPEYVSNVLARWARSSLGDASVTSDDLDWIREYIRFLQKLDIFRADLTFEIHGTDEDSEFTARCISMLGRAADVRVVRPTSESRELGPRVVVKIGSVPGSARGRKHVSRTALEYVLQCGVMWFDTDLGPNKSELENDAKDYEPAQFLTIN
ncbi:MAG TPA: hypothetical protein VF135_08330 [Terriglobales bacterium]